MCWIFFAADNGDMLLASGAQDNYIRMWRISSRDPCLSGDVTTSDLKLKEDCFSVISAGRFSYSFFYCFSPVSVLSLVVDGQEGHLNCCSVAYCSVCVGWIDTRTDRKAVREAATIYARPM